MSVLQGGTQDIERCPHCGGHFAWAERPSLILDPFAGSGTTGVAALAEGRRAVLIEREAEYAADIRERLAFYEGDGRQSLVAKNRNRQDAVGTLL